MRSPASIPALVLIATGCGGGHAGGDAREDEHDDEAVDAIGEDLDADEPEEEPLCWPNEESASSSDPWIMAHHGRIAQVRPRVLALNFVNARSMDEMTSQLEEAIAGFAVASRYHHYSDPEAEPALLYELAYAIDLRDTDEPPLWPYRNSTLYPREDPVEGTWGFDYEMLFSPEFAELYAITDPEEPGLALDLCALFSRGLVHEVWIYGDGDVPDVSAAEFLSLKPYYDEDRVRIDFPMNRCAGNGCFDAEDEIPCTSTVRISWFNNTRGPGCFLENFSHAFESMGAGNPHLLPTLSRDFVRFALFDLDTRYGLPFDSWYQCPYGDTCLAFLSTTSVAYDVSGLAGTIDPYDPACGNVHFIPNGRSHYDLENPNPVLTTCEGFGLGEDAGADMLRPFMRSSFEPYLPVASDCMGPFLVYWMQSFPSHGSRARDLEGRPILGWWPYLFY